MAAPILLYDGVCGLCNRFVQFILRHDRRSIFRFASLQSHLAGEVLARHAIESNHLNTVYVVVHAGQAGEILFCRSNAVLYVLAQLGGFWRAVAVPLQIIPNVLRDLVYDFVARHRYRVFGRSATCILPSREFRDRFLDL